MQDLNDPFISIIIPVKDEIQSINLLADEINNAFQESQWSWECVWIDDGSSDGTREAIIELRKSHLNHRYLFHDGNYGQSAALYSGFRNAAGTIIATLDGDLQNDPKDLLFLIKQLKRGEVDMVNGVRKSRHDSVIRKISSRIANGFRNWITKESVTDVGCSVRVFYKECVDGILLWRGMHRFLPTLIKMKGYKAIELPVSHRPRQYGKTKYGIQNRLWVGLADTFAVRWMQWRCIHPIIKDSSGNN